MFNEVVLTSLTPATQQAADYTENMDSRFFKTLEKKAAKAALWGR